MKKRNTILLGVSKIGKSLGLSDNEISSLMRGESRSNEQTSLSLGPPLYSGGHYGAISINDIGM